MTQSLPRKLLDGAKTSQGLGSDAKVAEWLGVSQQMVHQMKSGLVSVPAPQLAKLLRCYEAPIGRDEMLDLLHPDLAVVIKGHDLALSAAQQEPQVQVAPATVAAHAVDVPSLLAEAVGTDVDWNPLLDELKAILAAQSDTELAIKLQIPPTSVSHARSGAAARDELPVHSKFVVLHATGKLDGVGRLALALLPRKAREKAELVLAGLGCRLSK